METYTSGSIDKIKLDKSLDMTLVKASDGKEEKRNITSYVVGKIDNIDNPEYVNVTFYDQNDVVIGHPEYTHNWFVDNKLVKEKDAQFVLVTDDWFVGSVTKSPSFSITLTGKEPKDPKLPKP
jgi:hypothetical protein